MTTGDSGVPLVRKLGIKEGHRVVVLGGPAHLASLIDPLPPRARLERKLPSRALLDVVLVFARTHAELRDRFRRAQTRLKPNGGLWVAWPKGTSPLAVELKASDVRDHGLSAGLVDNKICAIDEDWSALRFVSRLANRP